MFLTLASAVNNMDWILFSYPLETFFEYLVFKQCVGKKYTKREAFSSFVLWGVAGVQFDMIACQALDYK